MAIIDADAHVVENERTWEYMDGADRRFKPKRLVNHDGIARATHWEIDGKPIFGGPVAVDEVVQALRELDDVPGRIRHMDELGTDIHVLFPTIFLRPVTDDPHGEIGLCQSYNRWLAGAWRKEPQRIRWAVVLPLRSMDKALEEIQFGKRNGACAVFMRGIDADRLPSDPYFFPLYEAAEALDLPICIHAATGNFTHHDLFPTDTGLFRFKVPGIMAFHTLLMNDVPAKFPTLRYGFIELSAQWVPYALHDLVRRLEKRGIPLDKTQLMHDNRFFVACQTDDDIEYVLRYAGEGGLVMGTDYGHADTSSELEALQRLRDQPGVSESVATKILGENPTRLYALA
jgi:predicted TIM-barrel fold metal-dependent hydrolase